MNILIRFTVCFTAFLIAHFLVNGQGSQKKVWNIGGNLGWGQSTLSDYLLNHHTYRGNSFFNVKIFGALEKAKHSFRLQLVTGQYTTSPQRVNPTFYEYNKIEQSFNEVAISYLYRIFNQNDIAIWVGGCNASYFSAHDENYLSSLYPHGLSYRKAYLLMPVNVMPFLRMDYTTGRNSVFVSGRYSIVSIAARPDDEYVKQIGNEGNRQWNTFFIGQFSGFDYSLSYQHNFGKIRSELSYEVIYNEVDGFQGFHRMLLAGLILRID